MIRNTRLYTEQNMVKNKGIIILLFLKCTLCLTVHAQYLLKEHLPYYEKPSSSYAEKRCKLDLYYPSHLDNYPTIIWFHGGGLKGGNKEISTALKEKGVAVVAVNYRLHPKVSSPTYIQDAATAVAWVFNYIQDYGGDPNLIFISGHSAGGYLTSMIGMDKSWLQPYGIDANKIAGLIPLSLP